MDERLVITWTVVLLTLGFCSAEEFQQQLIRQNPCILKQTCHECIQTPTCAWCAQPKFDGKRCFHINSNVLQKCEERYINNPDNEFSIVEARKLQKASRTSSSFSSSSSSSSGSFSSAGGATGIGHDAVQISPQKVALKLRINEAYRISLNYAQAEDYPVDLYYLMDLSKSMEDDKEKLSKLGNLLAESMQNITSNFRLGFGSFVDKVVMPYVSTVAKKLESPCDSCVRTYGYQNQLSLSSDTDRFSGEVQKASVSGNLDAPEGGFDAIMQAIVCREQIGWRERARRLLVFSTDAGFHYAGDGKLGGIVKPNDGQCHLDSRGSYTHSSLLDYPSISQINLKVRQNSINMIFAVTAEQISVYERLKQHIEGSSAGTLSNDSANVVDLVKDQYNKISSSVEMRDTASSAVKVTYYSSCLDKSGQLKQTNKCDGLKVGTVVKFQAEIEVTACPPNRKHWHQTFQIYPVGINESLTVNVEMQCDCPCENPGNFGYVEKSFECHGAGTLKCGVCECDPFHFGRTCECDANNNRHGNDTSLVSGCRTNNETEVNCSGRGECNCGQCDCQQRINPDEKVYGTYCECDNFSCDRSGGALCGGHGICDCGNCKCNIGWSGESCDCHATNDTCIMDGSNEICSGRGVCECGQCKCFEEDNIRYSGKYCQKCPTCPGRCQEFKDCIQCLVYKTGPLTPEECAQNCTIKPILVKVAEASEEKDENVCAYYDEDDCRFAYVYTYDQSGKVIIRAQEERECPPQVYFMGIIMGVIGAIVLIGMALLLLWKLLTTINDRREFAKFEKERMIAKWDTAENPIYRQATSTFKNPTYMGKS
ncbi:integrin beta-PS isoform X2 [Adelges cooleyi]|uniref:integrin beta-PS isoform X2 n=1 Tax=Adelges cooleyi TaxID=133065 RepID=UPI00217FE015|nr:integrin beta-PS isoform X2 [Adelges cooleyi]